MKAIKLLLFVLVFFLASSVKSQVSVSVNIGSPPMWGPVGYSDVEYYYLPDVYSYYDVRSSMFIYQSGGVWVHRTYLPTRYRNYDLYNGYKVVMTDYHGHTPYTHYKEHKVKYRKGYRGPAQKNIGERPERGNSRSGNRPSGHSYKQSKQSKGNSQGHGKGNMKKGNSHGGGHGKKK